MAQGIALGATKLIVLTVIGLQLVCLQQPNGANAQRAQCQSVPDKLLNYCCNTFNKGASKSKGKPPTPRVTAAQKRQLDQTKLGVECVQKFQELAKNPNKPAAFPMECCQVPMFASVCKETSYNRKILNQMLEKSRLMVNKEKGECSPKIAEQCCPWNIEELPRNSMSTVPKNFIGDLFACALAIVSNLVQGKFKMPESCCRLPVFNLFCSRPSDKPPIPRPPPPPPPPKTSPKPPNRLRSWDFPFSDLDY